MKFSLNINCIRIFDRRYNNQNKFTFFELFIDILEFIFSMHLNKNIFLNQKVITVNIRFFINSSL